jgi:hypothetical protein
MSSLIMAATYLVSVIGRLQGTRKFFYACSFYVNLFGRRFTCKIKTKIKIFKPLTLVYTI